MTKVIVGSAACTRAGGLHATCNFVGIDADLDAFHRVVYRDACGDEFELDFVELPEHVAMLS